MFVHIKLFLSWHDKVSKLYEETKQLFFCAYPEHSLCESAKGNANENKINNSFNTSMKMQTSPCGIYNS